MSNTGKVSAPNDTGDSAPVVPGNVKPNPTKPSGGGRGGGKGPPSSKPKTESSSSKTTPGFAEGNAALLSYGMSLSGYRERVLSPFKSEKFFHIVSTSYQRLLSLRPSLPDRFTYDEFLHCTALQLYQRIENVKFDALGVKPAAPTRIPLPRNLRVFQPIWSILANIGTVDDEELRVTYIPDAVLPDTDDLDSEHDVEGLLSCTLFDWKSSWEAVKKARDSRDSWQERDGYTDRIITNEPPVLDRSALIKSISDTKKKRTFVQWAIDEDIAQVIGDRIYLYPQVSAEEKSAMLKGSATESDFLTVDEKLYNVSLSDAELKKTPAYKPPGDYSTELELLMSQAKSAKKFRITPRFDAVYESGSYKISDGSVTASPGAYGARLHWDPQLWLDYENFVNEVAPLAMFSLSMPIETTGTYAWILPVEKRSNNDSAFCARMPKASIPTQTWVLALLLQSSTLPFFRRSTWYTESDYLNNLTGLRQRYVQSAIKAGAPVDQFGTY